jgi:alkanesulfonate monooxygenase SsuD/methylene tetrahydromethanopterin reductase-like flavin-dependent oxidoreductase (luciferase family)
VPPVEKALRDLETRTKRPGGSGRRAIIGSPATVRGGLEEVAAEYGADELVVLTITHDHEARRRSYELIASEFGLNGGDQAAPSSSVTTAR